MMGVNLDGFCDIQKDIWEKYTSSIKEAKCKKCKQISLVMTSKWKCICTNCNTKHTVRKPKNFPKNMNDKRNWKATCCECNGVMDYYENRSGGAYICRKCSNILEV